jgi:hypothetical protein
MNRYIFNNKRKLRDYIEDNRVAYALFELRGFFLGGRQAYKTKRHAAGSPSADQYDNRP